MLLDSLLAAQPFCQSSCVDQIQCELTACATAHALARIATRLFLLQKNREGTERVRTMRSVILCVFVTMAIKKPTVLVPTAMAADRNRLNPAEHIALHGVLMSCQLHSLRHDCKHNIVAAKLQRTSMAQQRVDRFPYKAAWCGRKACASNVHLTACTNLAVQLASMVGCNGRVQAKHSFQCTPTVPAEKPMILVGSNAVNPVAAFATPGCKCLGLALLLRVV